MAHYLINSGFGVKQSLQAFFSAYTFSQAIQPDTAVGITPPGYRP
jgi:hypothetical protein